MTCRYVIYLLSTAPCADGVRAAGGGHSEPSAELRPGDLHHLARQPAAASHRPGGALQAVLALTVNNIKQ